ncbi:nitrile hydratase subunit beta [Rhizobium bangladeshense]|uniref:SH3-like domain-containing protein n=1 Tax=Rhizobium bangladeshense TaxID=1138189 RepID=UPI001C83BBD7|nr:SH3-like domain-containing protein [Rhizobium bangladeshense]MBX4871024.1 nitrile hydratase subunit beta [Rhizobium bangladeshense]MBX4871324.1 nitrile hydratase subunit beta [Rhizobium bangladeshense]MBX4887588.1 nitrile hydratase subunit beta [Rhizobium bangladeshense]
MLPRDMVAIAIKTGASTLREVSTEPRFKPGDEVRTISDSPTTHTRLPRYAGDKTGTIIAYEGAHVFPDKHSQGLGECPEHLYRVRFDSAALWGISNDGPGAVYLSLWESYLTARERADGCK